MAHSRRTIKCFFFQAVNPPRLRVGLSFVGSCSRKPFVPAQEHFKSMHRLPFRLVAVFLLSIPEVRVDSP